MSKTKKIVIGVIVGWFAFCLVMGAVTTFFFKAIREDPIDNVAMPYLWDEEAITQQVGADIKHINRHLRTDEILAGLGQMYVADERFKKNIDKCGDGTAEFSSEAIEKALANKNQYCLMFETLNSPPIV